MIPNYSARRLLALVFVALVPIAALAQPAAVPTTTAAPEPPKDTLGRDSPRGTLLGFIRAARDGNDDVASLYLNTSLRGAAAQELAKQLFVVLDSRLPARLTGVSDKPEGSQSNPLRPDDDLIGTVTTDEGALDIIVERVNRGSAGRLWLFSRRTLDGIPDIYGEIDKVRIDRYLPGVLKTARFAGVRLAAWVALIVLLPLLYRILGGLSFVIAALLRRRRPQAGHRLFQQSIPGFVRLLLIAIAIRWGASVMDLPLVERQFWSIVGAVLVILAGVWGLLRLNVFGEGWLLRRSRSAGHAEATAVLRLMRRAADVLVIAIGVLLTLRYFGIDATAALAGLGIGGIAVALAAQKTLENVIGGLSIIFDKAVQVGDFLKLGDQLGTVESIGLRSTRIRTPDRTMLSVPNGQIANANIETLSARDKYRFYHVLTLSYETTATQMRTVLENLRTYLASHPAVDRADTIRVRFFRLGAFSLDIEVFAYIVAADWEQFLAAQQELLLETMAIVERAGAVLTLPSQTVYVAGGADAIPPAVAVGAVAGAGTTFLK